MRDQLISTIEHGFTCDYTNNMLIKRTIVRANKEVIKERKEENLSPAEDNNLSIAIELKDGTIIKHIAPNAFGGWVYMEQYGVDVSEDGKYYFLHDWYARGGLSCFVVETGELRWCVKIRHARRAYVNGDYILCDFVENGILKISIENGEIVKRIPSGGNTYFFRAGNDYYMLPISRDKYRIVDSEFNILFKIPYKALLRYNNSFIDDIVLDGNELTVFGREQSPELHGLAKEYWRMERSGIINIDTLKQVNELCEKVGVDLEHFTFLLPYTRTYDISSYRV